MIHLLRRHALEGVHRHLQHRDILNQLFLIHLYAKAIEGDQEATANLRMSGKEVITIPPTTNNPYLTKIKQLADPSLDRDRDELLRDLIHIQLCTLAFEGYPRAIDLLDSAGVVPKG